MILILMFILYVTGFMYINFNILLYTRNNGKSTLSSEIFTQCFKSMKEIMLFHALLNVIGRQIYKIVTR